MDYQGIGFLGYRPFSGLQIRAPYRLAVTDYRRMRSAVERILDWDFEQIIVVTFPTDAEAIEGNALLAMRHDFALERIGIHFTEVRGTVVEILVADGSAVEQGQVLLRVSRESAGG